MVRKISGIYLKHSTKKKLSHYKNAMALGEIMMDKMCKDGGNAKVYKPRTKRGPSGAQRETTEVVLPILRFLRAYGAVCGRIKTRASMIRGRYIKDPWLFVGFPDIACLYKGKFWLIEAKTDTGRIETEQLEFRRLYEESGGNYILARSVGDVMKIVD